MLIDFNVKLIKEGEVFIESFVQSTDQIGIKVSNNKRKLTKTEIEQIFDPFLSIRDGEVQSGFQLALCLKIIEAHGGTMEVSNQGMGSEYTITLPVIMKEV